MDEPTTEAGQHTHAVVRSRHSHGGYLPHDHSWLTVDDAVAGGYGRPAEARASQPLTLDVDVLAVAMIHIRGAHNPTADELEGDQETRPCAWCRLAAEQAVEAIARATAT